MTRCVEFYEKWAKDPNWCEKTQAAVSQINNYLKLVDELESQGIDRELTIVNLPEGVARPLIVEKDAEIKEQAISEVGNLLKQEQKKKERGLKTKKIKPAKRVLEDVRTKVVEARNAKQEYETTPEPELKTEVRNPRIKSNAKFNFTNDNIEWARWTWNPVRGCKHGCDYCYAKDIAMRFDGNFDPQLLEDRLDAPYNTKLTDEQIEEIGSSHHLGKTDPLEMVFVCSMADLFGDWVPKEWIEKTLKVVSDTPQWTYLFLTKNPKRLVDIEFPDNCWVGATIDKQSRVKPTEEAMQQVKAKTKFVSCEPLLEGIEFNNISIFDWIIIGGCSKTTKHPEVQPKWEWVEQIIKQARYENTIPLYCKPNMKTRSQEYPVLKG